MTRPPDCFGPRIRTVLLSDRIGPPLTFRSLLLCISSASKRSRGKVYGWIKGRSIKGKGVKRSNLSFQAKGSKLWFLVSGVIARGTIQGDQFQGKRQGLGE